MNCRPNELAFIVSGTPEEACDFGKIVLVVAAALWDGEHIWQCESQCGPVKVQSADGYWFESMNPLIYDCHLKPIRPDEGEDETLRIAGRPQETVREALTAIRELPS